MTMPWYLWIPAVLAWLVGGVYRLSFQLLFNIIFNCVYVPGVLWHWQEIRKERADMLCLGARTWYGLLSEYGRFQYRYKGLFTNSHTFLDKWPTWTAWLRVFVLRHRQGNCQDANHYALALIRAFNDVRTGADDERIRARLRVYVPVAPWYWHKPHYFVEAQYMGTSYIFSDGQVYVDRDAQWLAEQVLILRRLERNKKAIKYWVWIA